jgi:16S rRNA (guanine527-N7)-methyltransferase
VDRLREPLPTRVDDTQDLPPEYGAALDAGLAALAVRLTPTARAAIDGHARLLLAWTTAINLTAIRDPAAVAVAHVIDSLTAVAVLRERGIGRFVDLGSGGGYPGLPLAAVVPAERALLLEPIAKKAAFLSVVTAATGLDATVEAAAVRAEALAADPRHRGRWPGVTARAVASLADLVELAFPLLAPGGSLIAWKRGDIAPELAAAEQALDALGGGSLVVRPVDVAGLDGHRLVIATSRGRVPAAYPRDPGVRRRRPWGAARC